MSDTTIDEIFNKLTYGYEFQMSDYAGSREQELEYERQGKAEIAQAKSALYELMLEIIGEDEPAYYDWNDASGTPPPNDDNQLRNALRAEQRTKLKELFNE